MCECMLFDVSAPACHPIACVAGEASCSILFMFVWSCGGSSKKKETCGRSKLYDSGGVEAREISGMQTVSAEMSKATVGRKDSTAQTLLASCRLAGDGGRREEENVAKISAATQLNFDINVLYFRTEKEIDRHTDR